MTTLTQDALYEKLMGIKVGNPLCNYTEERVSRLLPLINEILELKKEKDAIILAHSYVHPDIIYGVADVVGDSFALAKAAQKVTSKTLVFPAVRFMAETAKILNPEKQVIDPNPNGGCSLADSITEKDVLELKRKYPEHTFVCYINTTAAVKAACDVCVTSSNALDILSSLPADKIYFLPDRFMGENLKNMLKKKGVSKELLFFHGSCYVHEEFDADQVALLKASEPETLILAHPECKPDVVALADQVASTSGMIDYVKNHPSKKTPFLLLTECGVISRLQVECPDAKLTGSCMLCKFMRSNSLESIRQSLQSPLPSQVIEISPDIQQRALSTLQAMFHYAKG